MNLWHHYAAIIHNVKELLERNWNVSLTHTLREANASADLLVKMGAASNISWLDFEDPPDGILTFLPVYKGVVFSVLVFHFSFLYQK